MPQEFIHNPSDETIRKAVALYIVPDYGLTGSCVKDDSDYSLKSMNEYLK